MPRAVETFLPPTPIRKATPAPKPAAADNTSDSARPEDFRDALKSASSKQSDQSNKAEEKPATKTTAKKPATKAQPRSTTKTAKSKTTDQDPDAPEAIDETETETDAAQAQASPQLPEEAQAESAQSAPTPEAHDPSEHPHDDPDPATQVASTDLAASQQVLPIAHPKDQPQKHAKEDHSDPIEKTKPDSTQIAAALTPPDQNASHPTVSATAQAQPVTPVKTPASKAPPSQAPATTQLTATETDPNDSADSATTTTTSATPTDDIPTQPTATTQQHPTTQPTSPFSGVPEGPLTLPTKTPIQPSTAKSTPPTSDSDSTDAAAATAAAVIANLNLPATATDTDHPQKSDDDATDLLAPITPDLIAPSHNQSATANANKPADLPPPAPEVEFAQTNHDKIVSSVQSQLLPHGGAMQIRLDPPELGALKVMVEMRDGVMNATFQTSNEQATQLLSHSLNQLKHVLESQGVTVERLQVQQAPKSDNANTDDRQQQQQQQRDTSDHHTAQQEQQRKELLQKMWRKVSGVADPIDYFA